MKRSTKVLLAIAVIKFVMSWVANGAKQSGEDLA